MNGSSGEKHEAGGADLERVEHHASTPSTSGEGGKLRIVIILGVIAILAAVVGLWWRADSRTNHVALTSSPKPVTVEKSIATTFRPVRTYVGATEAWNAARVGPQFVSAYVATVLVRPGASVKAGQVLGTLDCKNASAQSREIAARAKALEQQQVAVEHEAARVKELAQTGFASQNEKEQLEAKSASETAEIESLRASLVMRGLEVDDCILRAPFAGEVSDRYADPGAFVRPGNPVITVVDRGTVRVVADAPEEDFAVVAPGTPVNIEVAATGAQLQAKVARRAPAADPMTRTVHFEIDLANPSRALPVGATARLTIEVGDAKPATQVPLQSAILRGDKATLYVANNGKAQRVVMPVLGERGGALFVDPKLAAGSTVVIEGRALLEDGDAVTAKEAAAAAPKAGGEQK